MMGIDSICIKLLKTVRLLVIRLEFAKLRLLSRKKTKVFFTKIQILFFGIKKC